MSSNAFAYSFDVVDSVVLTGTGDGSVWRRSISDMTPPAAPELVLLPDGTLEASVSPILTWTHVDRAVSYHLQIAADTTFSSPFIDTFVAGEADTTDSTNAELQSNNLYYWRVGAIDTDGAAGPWSDVRSFMTILFSLDFPARCGSYGIFSEELQT